MIELYDPNDPNLCIILLQCGSYTGSYTGIENASYYFKIYIRKQNFEGGMVLPQYSQIYEISNHLKNTEILC